MHIDLYVYQDIVAERLEKVKQETYGKPNYRKRKKNKQLRMTIKMMLKVLKQYAAQLNGEKKRS